MSATRATDVELVLFEPMLERTHGLFRSLTLHAAQANVRIWRAPTYQGRCSWLVLWGPGHPDRAAVMAQHVAKGGHAVAWDLAYWHRDRKMRVSIDAAHPQAWVMRRDLPTARLVTDRVPVEDRWQPTGPVVVAGLGEKARVQYGASAVDAWEGAMAQACRARWPERPIVYRQKKPMAPVPSWASAQSSSARPIDDALRGVSLVVTWHSNVAVDAIRMGIPVICRDGAAAAVCPSTLGADDPQPLDPAVRNRFLANLAWFQWSPNEAPACWAFLRETLA